MASISASKFNDEGGREKNGMYQLWGGSQGIQEGGGGKGGGGGGGSEAKEDIEGWAGVLHTDGYATCKCIYIYTHKHIHTHTYAHTHTPRI